MKMMDTIYPLKKLGKAAGEKTPVIIKHKIVSAETIQYMV
jgi:hypothetical protein